MEHCAVDELRLGLPKAPFGDSGVVASIQVVRRKTAPPFGMCGLPIAPAWDSGWQNHGGDVGDNSLIDGMDEATTAPCPCHSPVQAKASQ